MLRSLTGAGLALLLLNSAVYAGNYSPVRPLRLAEAASDACLADCANRATQCRQACPSTFGAPCQQACDSQLQSCRNGCRPR